MLPEMTDWRAWSYDDHVRYYLSLEGIKKRDAKAIPALPPADASLEAFCAPIREKIEAQYSAPEPEVSVQLIAYNEEAELVATLLSYTLLDQTGTSCELIVVDNNSTDRTAAIVRACGARYVSCTEAAGPPFARKAGLAATHPAARYLFMSDGDTRVTRPFDPAREARPPLATVVTTSLGFIREHPTMVGLSTGITFEYTHPVHRLVREAAARAGRAKALSCWAGANQFVLKEALVESGGIDTSVLFGEDHQRHYQIARWAKTKRLHMSSANANPDELTDPVYTSGRRFATLPNVLRHWYDSARRGQYTSGKGMETEHEHGVTWRNIR